MTIRLRTLALVALLVAALAVVAGGVVVWMGVYNIAATRQHTALVFKVMEYAMRRSVRAHAADLRAPADLQDPARVRAGAAHFAAHCVQCHGAPGISPDPLAFGLRPAPANLLHAGRNWRPEEIFWVVKHGVKMTGMPAWEYRLADADLWELVAFLRTMPELTPAQYARLAARTGGDAPQGAPHPHAPDRPLRPGDAQAGRRAAAMYLCATCHSIPGMVGATQQVGPPLGGIARRPFIGGVIANTPDNMVRWLRNPQQVDPLSAMPALGLSEQDARDVAAFLSTLDEVARE